MRRQMKRIILIAVTILAVTAVILTVCLLRSRTDNTENSASDSPSGDYEQQVELSEETIALGSGLILTKLSEVTGNFPEDGKDEFTESMLSATFFNDGDRTIQYASVKVTVGGQQYSFILSTLPAGKTVRVFEADKKEWEEASGTVSAEIESFAYFQEEPSVYEDELEITVSDGFINVKNISGTDINKEISVFYKTVSGDTFVGGITYRFRVPAGLAAGAEYKGNAMHASGKWSKVMFVTYGK